MAKDAQPSVWQRAAVLGSLWASVEIVAGSFLHNLNVPLAGSVLAAFGVVVMTAGHRSLRVRGLIWRTALICALMKSISPSAVILGPMVGILVEGLLLEACVRLLGANAIGYVAGGALAVAWSLAQKVAGALIAFGPDVVRLYVAAYAYASKSLHVSRFGPFDLVATLVGIECLVGGVAAVVGMRLVPARGAAVERAWPAAGSRAGRTPVRPPRGWSLPFLIVFASGLVAGMVLLGWLPAWAGGLYVAGYAVLVVRRYPAAFVRLRVPAFWGQMIGVLLLAGLLLGGARNGAPGLLQGLDVGVHMALRAILALVAFTALAVELRNPRILEWLERRHFRGLSDALGLAFGALPAFTSALADQRSFWRRPVRAMAALMQVANEVYAPREGMRSRIMILTGETGCGKTTTADQIVSALRRRGLSVGGILARAVLADGRRVGFDLDDLSTGRTAPLCRESRDESQPGPGRAEQRWGRFEFARAGLAFGHEALTAHTAGADVIVVDEVGPLELTGGGWAGALDLVVRNFDGPILLVARLAVVDAVKARWGSPDTPVWVASHDKAWEIEAAIVEQTAPSEADGPLSAVP
jgi:nucleoside-triphosphatase THEP1